VVNTNPHELWDKKKIQEFDWASESRNRGNEKGKGKGTRGHGMTGRTGRGMEGTRRNPKQNEGRKGQGKVI